MIGSIRLCLVTLSLGLGTIATPAAANTITYNWRGVVDHIAAGSPVGVRIGEKIKISLTLDDSVPDTDPAPDSGRYDTQINPPILVVAVDIGDVTSIGSFQLATVSAGHNGTDSFTVGTGDQHIGNRFTVDFSTSHLGVLTSDALPLSINRDDFEMAHFFVNERGPFQGFLPTFDGRIVSSTPLPGSVGMLVSALAGLVGAGWWKSRRLRTTAL